MICPQVVGQFFLCSFAKCYSQKNLRERNSPGQGEFVTEKSLGESVLNSETFLHRVSRIASCEKLRICHRYKDKVFFLCVCGFFFVIVRLYFRHCKVQKKNQTTITNLLTIFPSPSLSPVR